MLPSGCGMSRSPHKTQTKPSTPGYGPRPPKPRPTGKSGARCRCVRRFWLPTAAAMSVPGVRIGQACAADDPGFPPLSLIVTLVVAVGVVTFGLFLQWRADRDPWVAFWPARDAGERFRAAVELSPDAILVHSGGHY